jgi:CheY-like chemotaxis protein
MNAYALIIDPEPASASSYAALARAQRLTSVCVRDGATALSAIVERGVPALMVVDPAVPQFDGFELIERLRRTAGGAKTPVVVVSADREQRDRAVELRERLNIGAVLAKAASDDSAKRVIQRLLADAAARAARPSPVPRPAGAPPATVVDPETAEAAAEDGDEEAPSRSSWAAAARRHLSRLALRRRHP